MRRYHATVAALDAASDRRLLLEGVQRPEVDVHRLALSHALLVLVHAFQCGQGSPAGLLLLLLHRCRVGRRRGHRLGVGGVVLGRVLRRHELLWRMVAM